jgi:hypothetical protein
MDIELLVSLLITSVVVIIGWFIAHWLSSKRDQENKRRDLRVQYLIEAWRKLENASNRYDNTQLADLETAIADIQLFGSPKQIDLAIQFVENFVNTKTGSLDELLNELRQSLRNELNLEAVSKNTHHLRIISNNELKKKQ